ncbi:CBS domain-containing protein [Microvirga massiliensis]|uniref:CBS domain-containing protein n=1 Tax=Microvirga massiliensis TaxID=1033741 RepID=UPI00065F9259|nr:CBS domain-containing protein [Microvirga massiliensis]
MSLERFRRTRMVVLNRRSTAYQAARAMADNHIGAVLVSESPGLVGIVTDRDLALAVLGGGLDPKTTALDEVMSEEVITCDISADVDEAVRLMREHGVRRIPLVEGEQPVGLVTFDDLVVDGSVSLEALRSIVTAQLEVEAPQKPAGMLHPSAATTAQARTRALMRAKARAEATYGRVVQEVVDATGLERDPSERALLVATCMLCRRLTPNEAQDLIAQLPSMLQTQLDQCLGGPDRSVTTLAIEDELGRSLGVAAERASEIVRGVLKVISENVSAGQIEEVRGQLPQEMKSLLPAAA